MENLEEEVYSLFKHKNFTNAKFLVSCLMIKDRKYEIIMQILEYESGNYSRSLIFSTQTYTSLFYEALAYKKISENTKAVNALNKILDNKLANECLFDSKLNELILNRKIENVYELLGDIYKETCESNKSKKMYKKAFDENFILKKSFLHLQQKKLESINHEEKLILPNISMAKFNGGDFTLVVQNELDKKIDIPYATLELKENNISNFVEAHYKNMEDRFCINDTNLTESDTLNYSNLQTHLFFDDLRRNNEDIRNIEVCNTSLLTMIKNFYSDLQSFGDNFEKYKKISPGFGTYYLQEYATFLAENGKTNEAIEVFDLIITNEKIYLSRMDVYSSLLYKKKEKDKLASLSRKLLKYYYNESITWAVLGNYYSLINNHKKSLSCLEKSLYIKMNFYTVNLIGHEYIQKQEFQQAKSYFNLSLLLEPDNYNALVGLGIAHFNTQHPEAGIFYMKRAISLVPQNLFIRYILIKCTIKEEMYEESISALEDTFKFRSNKNKEGRLDTLIKYLLKLNRVFDEYEEIILLKMSELCLKLKMIKEAKDILFLVKNENEGYKKVLLEINIKENRTK